MATPREYIESIIDAAVRIRDGLTEQELDTRYQMTSDADYSRMAMINNSVQYIDQEIWKTVEFVEEESEVE